MTSIEQLIDLRACVVAERRRLAAQECTLEQARAVAALQLQVEALSRAVEDEERLSFSAAEGVARDA